MSKTCARLTALVLLANAFVAVYVLLGSRGGGATLAELFSKGGHSTGSSSGMATTLWSRVDSGNYDPQASLSAQNFCLSCVLASLCRTAFPLQQVDFIFGNPAG